MARKRLSLKKRASIRKTKQILGIPTSAKDERGFRGEEVVSRALAYFKRKKRIKTFSRVMKFSGDDLAGKDFIVTLPEGEILPLQVKTYYNQDEIASYLQRGIVPVVVRLFDGEGKRKLPSKLYEEAKREVKRAIEDFQRPKEEEEEKVVEEEKKKERVMGRISRIFSRIFQILLGK